MHRKMDEWIDDNTRVSAIVSLKHQVKNKNAKICIKIRITMKICCVFFSFPVQRMKAGQMMSKSRHQGISWAINHEFLAVGQKKKKYKMHQIITKTTL